MCFVLIRKNKPRPLRVYHSFRVIQAQRFGILFEIIRMFKQAQKKLSDIYEININCFSDSGFVFNRDDIILSMEVVIYFV